MFSSEETGKAFWHKLEGQVRRHFSADTRGKMDNVIRGAIIWSYGSRPRPASATPAAAATDAPADATRRKAAVRLLDSQPSEDGTVLGADAADAAAAKEADTATSSSAEEVSRLQVLRLQADAARHGNKYARASELFTTTELEALQTGGALTGVNYENPCFADVVETALAYQQQRCGMAINDNPLTKMRVSTNLLGYIHSVVLGYFGEHAAKPGSRSHNQETNLLFFSRYHECVQAVNRVYDSAEFKLAERFDVYRTDDRGADFREAASRAHREAGTHVAKLEHLRRRI